MPPPPAQEQKGDDPRRVGESAKATSRTAVIDLTERDPAFEDGPDLPQGTRYLNSVLMPDDTVFTSNGSGDYRRRGASNILKAQFYDPKSNTFRTAAAPRVGRDYRSEALLLPDGRVATFGSAPLFDGQRNTELGHFEQRTEIYTPPTLHRYGRTRPVLGAGPQETDAKGRATFATTYPERIAEARLMRPSAVTHSTDVEQRSIALPLTLPLTRTRDSVTIDVPSDRTLVPPGWSMLFVTDGEGTPSKAKWIQVR